MQEIRKTFKQLCNLPRLYSIMKGGIKIIVYKFDKSEWDPRNGEKSLPK